METLVYWVLMQATKDMEEDLRRILGELEHTDKAKAALRTPIHELSGLHQEFAAFVREEFARGDRPVAGGIPTWVARQIQAFRSSRRRRHAHAPGSSSSGDEDR